jgi:glycosyltransferase involved in cell wall biosynthesis
MNNLKLSICIATYNRAAFICKTLDSIIPQIRERDQVEIVIVDGCSQDNSEAVVRRYQEKCPRLRYFRRNSMGVDRDFNKAIDLANGEYCWLMADDDILKPGAIDAILNALENDYSLVIVNAEVRSVDLCKIIENKRLRISSNQTYKPSEYERLFVDTGKYLSYIGCVVIKRSVWNQRQKESYFGSLFIHVGVIFQSVLPGDTLVIAEPWIQIRYGNALWTSKGFEIWMFKWPNIIWSFQNFPNSAKEQICQKEPWNEIKTLLANRATGVFGINEYYYYLESRISSRWKRNVAKIIARLPGCVLNMCLLVYYKIFHKKSGMPEYDLKMSRFNYKKWWWKAGVEVACWRNRVRGVNKG